MFGFLKNRVRSAMAGVEDEDPKDKASREKEAKAAMVEMTAWVYWTYIIFAGMIIILLVSLFSASTSNSFWTGVSVFGRGLLIGASAFACGGFTGFLFGIPNMLQNEETQKQIKLKYNDNFIQISDWITKIIVGVGLIELRELPDTISHLGNFLKQNFGDVAWAKTASLGIFFYFLLFGFLIIYFWTRTDFTKIIFNTNSELDQEKIEKMVVNQNEKIDEQIEKINEQRNQLDEQIETSKKQNTVLKDLVGSEITKRNTEMVDITPGLSRDNKLDALKEESPDIYKAAIDELKTKVETIIKNKPITNKEDLQKGRWGGKSDVNGKQIMATVTASGDIFYDILIEVIDKEKPLDTPLAVFVHDTFGFPNDVVYAIPNANGTAQVLLTAYEAFTVGALFPDGTELELDLNEQKGYPDAFYWGKSDMSSLSSSSK